MKDLGPFPKATDMSQESQEQRGKESLIWGGRVAKSRLALWLLGIKVEILGGRNLKLHGRRTEGLDESPRGTE